MNTNQKFKVGDQQEEILFTIKMGTTDCVQQKKPEIFKLHVWAGEDEVIVVKYERSGSENKLKVLHTSVENGSNMENNHYKEQNNARMNMENNPNKEQVAAGTAQAKQTAIISPYKETNKETT